MLSCLTKLTVGLLHLNEFCRAMTMLEGDLEEKWTTLEIKVTVRNSINLLLHELFHDLPSKYVFHK